MIVFDLRCSSGHVFEAWFASSTAFEDQRGRGLVACPLCGVASVEKAVMAPNVAAKGNRSAAASPERVKAALKELAAKQAEVLQKSTWVGREFADQARAMHVGETDHAPIYGEASAAEAKSLVEDGVAVAPLPFPVVPPAKQN
ncbi:MAG TPA: DUF1178 family protein [Sphingomicrobium sp.]